MRPLWLAAPVLSLLITQGLAAQDTTAYRIASLAAFLFTQTTGRIDTTDLLADDTREPFNAIIGGGLTRGSPSGATFVVVQLTGPHHVDQTGHRSGPFTNDTSHSLQLTAQIDGRTVLERAVRLRSLFSPERQVWVPFVVYGTGCGVLKLTATLLRERQPEATLERSVNFRCGE